MFCIYAVLPFLCPVSQLPLWVGLSHVSRGEKELPKKEMRRHCLMAAAEEPEREPGCSTPAPRAGPGPGSIPPADSAARGARTAKTPSFPKGSGPGCQTRDGQEQRAAAGRLPGGCPLHSLPQTLKSGVWGVTCAGWVLPPPPPPRFLQGSFIRSGGCAPAPCDTPVSSPQGLARHGAAPGCSTPRPAAIFPAGFPPVDERTFPIHPSHRGCRANTSAICHPPLCSFYPVPAQPPEAG